MKKTFCSARALRVSALKTPLPFCHCHPKTACSLSFSRLVPASSQIMSLSFWALACNSTLSQPLHALLDTVYASCGVTVSWGCCC